MANIWFPCLPWHVSTFTTYFRAETKTRKFRQVSSDIYFGHSDMLIVLPACTEIEIFHHLLHDMYWRLCWHTMLCLMCFCSSICSDRSFCFWNAFFYIFLAFGLVFTASLSHFGTCFCTVFAAIFWRKRSVEVAWAISWDFNFWINGSISQINQTRLIQTQGLHSFTPKLRTLVAEVLARQLKLTWPDRWLLSPRADWYPSSLIEQMACCSSVNHFGWKGCYMLD